MMLRKYIIKNARRAENINRLCFSSKRSKLKICFLASALILMFGAGGFPPALAAQKIAVLIPESTELSEKYAENFRKSLSTKLNVLDDSLSETAFRSIVYENPFNLSVEESKNVGAVVGCDYFILFKPRTLRRSAFQREEFYESVTPVYLVSSRTGRLVFWKLESFEAATPKEAEKMLFDSTERLASEIFEKTKNIAKEEINEKPAAKIEEVPDDFAPDAKNTRPPLPYKRLKPEYTSLAYIFDVKATIDISVDLDENGAILRTEIVRWAGYGLDESVINTIRRMNWRAAMRDGKTLPMRVLLRYNFKKIEKQE